MTKRSRTLAATALAIAVLGPAAPAHAERYSIDDPADATASRTDVHRLTVSHGEQRVRFAVGFDDLRRRSSAGMTLFLNTDPEDKGPEYALGTGLSDGTDYALIRIEGWRDRNGERVDCRYHLRLRYRADVASGWISRGCLERPDTVAAAVKMVDVHDASHPVVDWAPGTRELGLPVAAG